MLLRDPSHIVRQIQVTCWTKLLKHRVIIFEARFGARRNNKETNNKI